MDRLLNVMTFFSVSLIALVLFSVRRSHIRVEYSVSWLGAAVTLLLLSRSRNTLEWLASMLQLTYAPLALLFLVLLVFLVVFYRFSVIISELKDANIALAQKVAILEYRIESVPNNEKVKSTGA
ncbi:MAG: DUF2304 domain-containing protein [Bryobacteraceae bacterium]|nr:DUF2304 domain-containing protein [Bryobacteraceae bacterium]